MIKEGLALCWPFFIHIFQRVANDAWQHVSLRGVYNNPKGVNSPAWEDVNKPEGMTMSNTQLTTAQATALAVLEQANEYYTHAAYVPAKPVDEPVEYYEYAAAA